MTDRIYTAIDHAAAWQEATRAGDMESLRLLTQHHYHADHCSDWEVLAWPCPTAAKVLDRLLGDAMTNSMNRDGGGNDVRLTAQDLDDLSNIIAPGAGLIVNPGGYSADMLRGIIARHLTAATPSVENNWGLE